MSSFVRTQVPLFVGAALTFYMLVEFFIPVPILTQGGVEIRTWGVIIAAFTMGLGVTTLVDNNLRIIRRRGRNWPYYLYSLILMCVMIVTGLMPPMTKHFVFLWLYNNAFSRLAQAMYSILAFFITTATFRAFRATTFASACVLVAGIFVILTLAPIGAAISPVIPVIGTWVQNVPNLAGMRAIVIGVGIGIVALGVRTILGYERGHLAGGTGGGAT